jgi:RNA polymerase sigma-70 factor (ECF subfamily)
MEKIDRYDAARRFDVWLFSVARNLAIDHFRARRFESLDEPEETGSTRGERLAAGDPGVLTRLLDSERSAVMAECIAGMPAIHREVLALRFEEEMKLEEIAEVAGIPLSTVKSRLGRALVVLRARIEKRMMEGQ